MLKIFLIILLSENIEKILTLIKIGVLKIFLRNNKVKKFICKNDI